MCEWVHPCRYSTSNPIALFCLPTGDVPHLTLTSVVELVSRPHTSPALSLLAALFSHLWSAYTVSFLGYLSVYIVAFAKYIYLRRNIYDSSKLA